MRKGGQAAIWGIGALLLAFGLTALLYGYDTQQGVEGNLSLIFENGSLESGTYYNASGGYSVPADELAVPGGDYDTSIECDDSGTCTHTYAENADNQQIALLQYIIGIILVLFSVLSFYMAHQV
jgi:hypothetical protein